MFYNKIKYFCSVMLFFIGMLGFTGCGSKPQFVTVSDPGIQATDEKLSEVVTEPVQMVSHYEDAKQGEEAAEGKVNINAASKELLMTLYGVGEVRAEAIIAYRKNYGPFEKEEDIMKVYGIGEGIFRRIKDQITVK